MVSPPRSEQRPLDPGSLADPVGGVVAAHHDGRDLALRTSGTTTGATRVVRSTRSWWASFPGYSELSGVGRGARVWLPGPPASTMNLFAAVHARVHGACVVDRPERATHACVTPAVLARRGGALGPGTRVVVAGDALPRAAYDAATDRGLDMVHYYGAAELSFVAAGAHAGDLHPFPGVEVEVRAGTIWARSPYLARGVADPNGWATAGDLGRLHGDRLVVTGRPDTVTTAGATVPLAAVESALADRARGPFAVVGVPHPVIGAVLAAAVTDPGDRRRLRDHARHVLPPSHRPRLWRVLHDLPLTPAGKVDRDRLADLLRRTDDG
ncbi:MAG: AMP-binding enzyme [Marmoricola sp.]